MAMDEQDEEDEEDEGDLQEALALAADMNGEVDGDDSGMEQ